MILNCSSGSSACADRTSSVVATSRRVSSQRSGVVVREVRRAGQTPAL